MVGVTGSVGVEVAMDEAGEQAAKKRVRAKRQSRRADMPGIVERRGKN
jgi:hypothetical protein